MIEFSIDPSGRWTERQLDRVLPVLNEEAAQYRITFYAIEVTAHGDSCRWYILSPRYDSALRYFFEANNIYIYNCSYYVRREAH